MSAAQASAPRLGPVETERLWRAWSERGDAAARDRLVLSAAPMVRFLAHKKARTLPSHLDVDDLIARGMLAVVAAADRFDPAHGATFECYVWNRVSGAILDELRAGDWASRSVRRDARRLEVVRQRLAAEHGRIPTETELAAALGIDPADLRRLLADLDRATLRSLDAGADDSEAAGGIGALEAADSRGDPELASLSAERADAIRQVIAGLSDRERRVLGLVCLERSGGSRAGQELGISPSRVSQILARIRSKLQEALAGLEQVPDRALGHG